MRKQRKAEVDALLDRAAITDLIYRFAHGLDHHDTAAVASCFTDAAVFVRAGEPRLVSELHLGARQDPTTVRRATGLDRIDVSTHSMTDVTIDLRGDTATAQTVVLTTIVGHRDGVPAMRFRGIRFYDDLVRHRGEWKFSRRRHDVMWMFEPVPSEIGGQ
jgi:ketosteroid isomerase-like protein